MDPVQDREIFSLKDEKDEIGRFHLVLDDRLWRAGLEFGAGGGGGLGCGFEVGVPYGPSLFAMATREGWRRRSGFERWGTMAADERGDGSEAGNCLVVRAAGRLARTGQCGRGWHATDVRAVLLCARTWSCGPVPVHATRGVRAGSCRRHTCGSYSDPN